MADAEQQQGDPGHGPSAEGASEPPPTPEEAPAEGKSTSEGTPSPPVDTAAGGPGKVSDVQTPPAAAEAPKPAPRPAAERPARPAREAEAKEAPRVEPPPGSLNEVIAAALPDVQLKAYMVPALTGESVAIEVPRDDVPAVLTLARDDPRLGLRYLRCLSGVDWQEEGLEVVYHLASLEPVRELTVKTRVSYEDAVVPSVAAIYPAADWHEREARDMFGIVFEGHPGLVPLLLPEDMTDHFPLRKDNPLQEIEEWQGENLREGAGEGDEE